LLWIPWDILQQISVVVKSSKKAKVSNAPATPLDFSADENTKKIIIFYE
jgi:hypothetical protein